MAHSKQSLFISAGNESFLILRLTIAGERIGIYTVTEKFMDGKRAYFSFVTTFSDLAVRNYFFFFEMVPLKIRADI